MTIENINVPGYTTTVDAVRYQAMRQALMRAALPTQVSPELFPDAGQVGGWAKAVQLDLEVKGLLIQEATKPVRWHRRSHR